MKKAKAKKESESGPTTDKTLFHDPEYDNSLFFCQRIEKEKIMLYNVDGGEQMKRKRKEECSDCGHCEYSLEIADEENVLCPKKGVVNRRMTCRKFSLDILKIKPAPRELPSLDYSDSDCDFY